VSAYAGAVRVTDKHGKPARWVVTVCTAERGLGWLIATGENELAARHFAFRRLRHDSAVDVLSVISAKEAGI